jgi:hypothetical protein
MNKEIKAYNKTQEANDRQICEALSALIDKGLRGADSKIWHRHPVWFLEGNPIVGYSKAEKRCRDRVGTLFGPFRNGFVAPPRA